MSAGLAQPDCVQTTFTDRPVAPCVLYQSIVPTLTAYPATVGSVKCKAGATDAADCADFEPPPAPPGPLPPLPPPPPAPPPAVVTPLWDAAPLLASGVRAIPTYLDQVNAFTMARGSKLCKDFDIILLLSPLFVVPVLPRSRPLPLLTSCRGMLSPLRRSLAVRWWP